MKRERFKYASFILIILFTIVLVFIELFLTEEASEQFPFIWSLSLIPIILISNLYPKWKVIIGSGVFYSLLKYTTEFGQKINPNIDEINALILGTLINWSVILTIGYFIIKYYKLFLKVEELTITDSLTGIYNRRYLELFMEKSLPIYKKTNSSIVFMMLDIDRFKKINDNYGHQCGDEALRHFSGIISNLVRNTDVFVRFGGEEFAVILPNTDVTEGLIIAERIREAVEESEFIYKNERIHFTISIGVSLYNGGTAEEAIERSDTALYKAKEDGRNQIAIIN